MYELFNHLWQTTLFAAAIGVIAIALRQHSARTRYWLWLAASIKFLVPFSLLVSLGDRVPISMPAGQPSVTATTVVALSTGFSPAPAAVPAQASQWPLVAALVWAMGAILIAAFWLRRWFSMRATVRRATAYPVDFPVPVRITQTALEPGIFGFFRPVLVLPAGLNRTLTTDQLRAVMAHELSHAQHWDNLTSALHMVICAIFWFHPLVWWIGSKLVEERERACDESVLEQGSPANVYAASILNVCRFYLESPLPCASGVTGADLKRRIREIMEQRLLRRLTVVEKVALVAVVCGCIALPTLLGVLRAQTLPPAPKYTYEVVSIRPAKPGETNSWIGPGPQGGIRAQNISALKLLTFAYRVPEFQLAEVPGWAKDVGYDVTFTPDKPEDVRPDLPREQLDSLFDRQRQRAQAVLRDRFGLILRTETRQLPFYSLTQAKGGHKLSAVKETAVDTNLRIARHQMTGSAVYMDALAENLALLLDRSVVNNTGLSGAFNFNLEWNADNAPRGAEAAGASAGVSIFTALTEQLGLKVESKRGPVPVFVIEKIEKPSEN